jgi:hypothetical protein
LAAVTTLSTFAGGPLDGATRRLVEAVATYEYAVVLESNAGADWPAGPVVIEVHTYRRRRIDADGATAAYNWVSARQEIRGG